MSLSSASSTLRTSLVTNQVGTSPFLTLLTVLLPISLSLLLYVKTTTTRRQVCQSKPKSKPKSKSSLLFEYTCIWLPLLLSTIPLLLPSPFPPLSSLLDALHPTTFTTITLTLFLPLLPHLLHPLLHSPTPHTPTPPPTQTLTYIRFYLLLLTSLSILSVDFPTLYPRQFVKTERRGYGVMDIGTGASLFVKGLSSRASKSISPPKSRPSNTSGLPISATMVLFVIGALRTALVASLNYQTHTSEYGVVWNFFFTFAITHYAGVAINNTRTRPIPIALCLLSLALGYSCFVELTDFGVWMFDAGRVGFIEGNREGLFGLIGYLTIQQLGVCFGRMQYWCDASKGTWLKPTIAFWFIWWMLEYGVGWECSRRTTNVTYVFWIAGVVCSIVDYVELCLSFGEYKEGVGGITPRGVEAVNKNGMVFFLVSNLLTGAVNLALETETMGKLGGTAVMIGYVTLLFGGIVVWNERNKKGKIE